MTVESEIASDSEVAATLERSAGDRDELTPGMLLRTAREHHGIALERIADDLHLSKQIIEAMEADEYTAFSAPVFAKGHLRRYALRLSISADDILTRYARLDAHRQSRVIEPRSSEMSRPIEISSTASTFRIAPRAASRRSGVSSKWSVSAIVVSLIAVGWFVWLLKDKMTIGHAPNTTVVLSNPVASDSVVSVPNNNDESIAASTSNASGIALQATKPIVESTQTQSVTAAPTQLSSPGVSPVTRGAVSSGKLRIQLKFTEESWTEVTDGKGNRMMYDVGRIDLPRVIDVEPPIHVLLGNAPSVSIQVNNKPLSIPANRIINSVARFDIDANGVAH
jgi:cytoskeleton protein RodZ